MGREVGELENSINKTSSTFNPKIEQASTVNCDTGIESHTRWVILVPE
jgi:hypothetical protein